MQVFRMIRHHVPCCSVEHSSMPKAKQHSLQSLADSEFLALSALVCWRFLGDSAFPKKLSPQWIPTSVDSEDSIIGTLCTVHVNSI